MIRAVEAPAPGDFVNPELPVALLPAAEQVSWQALPRRYRTRLQVARATGVALAGALAVGLHWLPDVRDAPWREWWMSGLLAAALAAWAAALLAWPAWLVARCGYVLRDKDILYKSGVFWQSVKAVPFNRVQHAETGSTPLDRRFGLANLTVYTAGGSGGDLRIAGLERETAERLRVHIVGRLGDAEAAAESGEGVVAEAGGAPFAPRA